MINWSRMKRVGWALALAVAAVGVRAVESAVSKEAGPIETGPIETGAELIDCVMPMADLSGPGIRWSVSVRVIPAFDPEWLLMMSRDDAGGTVAEIARPDGFRIGDSLSKLPPKSSCIAARSALRVKRCTTDSTRSATLRRLADDFEKHRWPALPNPGLTFDAPRYDVRVQGFQDEVRLLLHDRGGARTHPVVRWATAVRKATEDDCTR